MLLTSQNQDENWRHHTEMITYLSRNQELHIRRLDWEVFGQLYHFYKIELKLALNEALEQVGIGQNVW